MKEAVDGEEEDDDDEERIYLAHARPSAPQRLASRPHAESKMDRMRTLTKELEQLLAEESVVTKGGITPEELELLAKLRARFNAAAANRRGSRWHKVFASEEIVQAANRVAEKKHGRSPRFAGAKGEG